MESLIDLSVTHTVVIWGECGCATSDSFQVWSLADQQWKVDNWFSPLSSHWSNKRKRCASNEFQVKFKYALSISDICYFALWYKRIYHMRKACGSKKGISWNSVSFISEKWKIWNFVFTSFSEVQRFQISKRDFFVNCLSCPLSIFISYRTFG